MNKVFLSVVTRLSWAQPGFSDRLVGILASSWPSRLTLILMGFVVGGLLYHYVWQPLRQPPEPFPGITSSDVSLNEAAPQQIISQRQERLQYTPQSLGAPHVQFDGARVPN